MLLQSDAALSEVVVTGITTNGDMYAMGAKMVKDTAWLQIDEMKKPSAPPVQPRKNFNESAFFFPDLKTDTSGNISFSFTMPEALTEWKWMTLAHTKDLS